MNAQDIAACAREVARQCDVERAAHADHAEQTALVMVASAFAAFATLIESV